MGVSADEIVDAADIEDAYRRIEGVVHRTPLDTSSTFASLSGAEAVGLKLETMQRTGSFKIRGAYNKLSQLDEAAKARGVIASSAGNHAQGVALAGDLLDIETTIVVPEMTPRSKIRATESYGAEVLVEGDIYERSYEFALEYAEEHELTFVHPFNDEAIISGQGTVGTELLDQWPDLDTVIVPIGGGGLISGIATAAKASREDMQVIGVQPDGAAHAKPSLENGEIHELADVDTIADGIADTRLLEKTFAVIRERVDDVVVVSDAEIEMAMALLAERSKVVAEPAGATPIAALLSEAFDADGRSVAAVISGGNVDLADFGDMIRNGQREFEETRHGA